MYTPKIGSMISLIYHCYPCYLLLPSIKSHLKNLELILNNNAINFGYHSNDFVILIKYTDTLLLL